MEKKTRSLLEELNSIAENKDTRLILESRANNIINSAIHLLEVIEAGGVPGLGNALQLAQFLQMPVEEIWGLAEKEENHG